MKLTAALKRMYGLADWAITLNIKSGMSDCYGQAQCAPQWEQAEISLWPDKIIRDPDEAVSTVEDTLEHELCEVVMSKYIHMLPTEVRNTDAVMEYRDACAEAFRRIIKRARNSR